MSERRERELLALRTHCPVSWTNWAREHGSETLRRAVADGYPYVALLRQELLDEFCPRIVGERDIDLPGGYRIELGDEREPNAKSFAMLDVIQTAARKAWGGPRCPQNTGITLERLRRAKLIVEPGAQPIHASAAGIGIDCGLMTLTCVFIWGRSDR